MSRTIEEIQDDLRQIEQDFYRSAKDRDEKRRHYEFARAHAECVAHEMENLRRELGVEIARQKESEALPEVNSD